MREVKAHALVPAKEEEGEGKEEREKLPPGHHGSSVKDEGVKGLQHGEEECRFSATEGRNKCAWIGVTFRCCLCLTRGSQGSKASAWTSSWRCVGLATLLR